MFPGRGPGTLAEMIGGQNAYGSGAQARPFQPCSRSSASKLGRPLVVSEAFARLTTRPTEELGCFPLKGLPDNVRIFAPGAYDMRSDAGGPQGAGLIPPGYG